MCVCKYDVDGFAHVVRTQASNVFLHVVRTQCVFAQCVFAHVVCTQGSNVFLHTWYAHNVFLHSVFAHVVRTQSYNNIPHVAQPIFTSITNPGSLPETHRSNTLD